MQNLGRILSSINDAVWSFDLLSNKFIYKNDRLAELYETPSADVEESPHFWLKYVHPDDYTYAITESEAAFEGKNIEIEYRLIINDKIKWVSDKKVVLLDKNNTPLVITGILSDITEKKASEVKLSDTEKTYRYLFINNPNPLWIYDRETLQFLAVNNAAVAKYGYSREEFLSMTIADIRPKEDVPGLLAHVNRIQESYSSSKRYWRHRTKAGDVLYVSISGHGITHHGRSAEIVMAHDITAEVESRKQIMLAKENLDALINNIDQEIWSIDKKYRLISANKSFNRATEEAIGRKLHIGEMIFTEEYDDGDLKLWKAYYDTALSGKPLKFVEFISLPGRKPYFAETKMHPIRNKRKVIGVACISNNIQERLEAHERVLSLNKKLHDVISLASHDIRGPVASLLGLTATFNKDDMNDPSNQEIINLVRELAITLDSTLHMLVEKSHSLREEGNAINGARYSQSANELS